MFALSRRSYLCLPAMLVLISLVLSACGSGFFGDGPDREPIETIRSGLPPLASLPLNRDPSIAYDEMLEGRETDARSGDAIDNGTFLDLPAATDQLCWGIWGWDAQERELTSISYDFDVPAGSELYIALADFAAMRWEVEGPFSDDTQYPLDAERHRSSSGMVYCAAITWDGSLASVRTVTLRVDSGTSFNEAEDNGSFSEANKLPPLPFTDWTGHAGPPGIGGDEYDYYSFRALEGQVVTITLTWNNAEGTLHLALYDPDKFFLVNDDEGNPGSRVIQHGLVAGTHWVRVRAFEGACDYSLSIDVINPGFNEQEQNDTTAEAQQVVAPLLDFLGSVGVNSYDGDDYDYFAFTAAAGDIATISLYYPEPTANLTMRLLDSDSTVLAADEDANPGQRDITCGLQAGIHYIRVHSVAGGSIYLLDLTLTQPGYDEFEDNDILNEANAVSLPLNDWYGSIGEPGYDGDNFDCVSFTAEEGDVVTATLEYQNASANVYLQLFGPNQTSIKLDNGANTGTRTIVWGLQAGTHYLRMQADSGATDYTLDVSLASPGYEETEDNDSYDEADELTPPVSSLLGSLGPGGYDGDDEDYFFFTAAEGQLVSLNLSYDNTVSNFTLRLLDPDKTSIYVDDEANPGIRSFQWGLKAGTYYLRVKALSGSGDYDLDVTLSTPGYWEDEDNDSIAQAQQIGISATDFYGSIGDFGYDGDGADYFYRVVSSPQHYDFHLDYSSATAEVRLYLLDSGGAVLASDTAGNPGFRDIAYDVTAGTYYLKIDQVSGGSDYYLDVMSSS